MNARSIIMGPESSAAIRDGRKTQSRRVVKPQPLHIEWFEHQESWCAKVEVRENGQGVYELVACPYGEPGSILYVKESHYRYGHWIADGRTKTGKQAWRFVGSKSNVTIRYMDDPPDNILTKRQSIFAGWYKRSPLFMPRWASRLSLELTDVRVERVQDISEKDSIAEGLLTQEGDGTGPGWGCKWHGTGYWGGNVSRSYGKTFHVPKDNGDAGCNCYVGGPSPAQCAYAELWDRINQKRGYSFESNPFVWALGFKRVGS